MSAMNHPTSAFAALTDKEIEVLRLLAAGHTVKSIAVQLGRSEASINERLRDARRKTCVGSSRELARLLDAQKIWDKNIDLSLPHSVTEAMVQPPGGARKWSKGTIMLLISIPIAAAGLVMANPDVMPQQAPARPAQAAALSKSPLAGTWSLDVARIPAEERPQRVTIRFATVPNGKWAVHVEIVGPDGVSRVADSVAAADGVPVPIAGNMDFIDSASLRQPGPNTLVLTLGKQGTPVSTRVYTVSKDGKSMTETIVWAGQDMPKLETTYFNRVD